MTKEMLTERPGKPPFVSKNLFIFNEPLFVSSTFVEHQYLKAL